MNESCILAIDQGTTSSRAVVFDARANIICAAQQEFPQIFPKNGWVEHDPEAIWSSVLEVSQQAFKEAEGLGYGIAAIGVTNQRETTLIWDRDTGKPVYNAIVWQDRRTADLCGRLRNEGLEETIQKHTGLLLDPYFSAGKIAWILDHTDTQDKAVTGKLAFGTVDSFVIWRLTCGATHATDVTNASRTSLFNIHELAWDPELLRIFDIPKEVLPDVLPCDGDFGVTDAGIFGKSIPVFGVAGDQQAATIGQCCFSEGDIKSTFGTGCFVMLNTGSSAVASKNRLLTTIAYQFDNETRYALEGSIFAAGSAVQWLRDELQIIDNASDTEKIAASLDDNAGVYLVPAFTGMGAPYWDPDARAALIGITRATGRAELVRATLEAVVYQTYDLLQAMENDGVMPAALRIDGGMVTNNWFVGFLADILQLSVDRPKIAETTVLGAAYLAGQKIGVYGNPLEFSGVWQRDARFEPSLDSETRERWLAGWRSAVRRVLSAHD